MRRSRVPAVVAVVLGVAAMLTTGPARASDNEGAAFPSSFALPDGFQPEGVAIGPGPYGFFGSLVDGSIYRVNLRAGDGEVFSEGPGTPSVGLDTDARGRLFVAGGPGGDARVIDTRTGEVLASYQLVEGETFVNDVIVTRDAAWFTDSVNPVLYRLPLGSSGQLPEQAAVETVPLTGDLVYQEGFNANGIESAPDGRGLLVVQSNTGQLFRVGFDGVASEVDLAGESLLMGDGLLRHGTTLYAVQNRNNEVAVLRLDPDGTRATLDQRVSDPRFDVPTTIAKFGNRLYLPNARFGTPPEPTTEYTVNAIPRP